jgi:hypothetical protein
MRCEDIVDVVAELRPRRRQKNEVVTDSTSAVVRPGGTDNEQSCSAHVEP